MLDVCSTVALALLGGIEGIHERSVGLVPPLGGWHSAGSGMLNRSSPIHTSATSTGICNYAAIAFDRCSGTKWTSLAAFFASSKAALRAVSADASRF